MSKTIKELSDELQRAQPEALDAIQAVASSLERLNAAADAAARILGSLPDMPPGYKAALEKWLKDEDPPKK